MDNLELAKMAGKIRKGIVTAVHSAKAGHPGGSLSAADIFTYLYFEEMNIDPENPDKPERDRFVLSKGHTAPGLYSHPCTQRLFPVEDLHHPCVNWVPIFRDIPACSTSPALICQPDRLRPGNFRSSRHGSRRKTG